MEKEKLYSLLGEDETADVKDFDEMFIDIQGLAKHSAERELKYLLEHGEITEKDFRYELENDVNRNKNL